MANRGNSTKDSWEQIRKNGGVAPIDGIREFLRREEEGMLSREELISRIENYFLSCVRTIEDEKTGAIETVWATPPTKSGLARTLGCQVQTLLDYINNRNSKGNLYSHNPDYKRVVSNEDFDLIKKAYLLIEEFYEMQLSQNKNNSGSIFWLLNSRNGLWSNEQAIKIEPEFLTNRERFKTLTFSELPNCTNLPRQKNEISFLESEEKNNETK